MQENQYYFNSSTITDKGLIISINRFVYCRYILCSV